MRLFIAAVLTASLAIVPAAEASPLKWSTAKRKAKAAAWRMPVNGDRVEINWCNRWGPKEVHCGVTETNERQECGEYGCYDNDTFCSGTAKVRKRDGKVRVRISDLSCFYG